MKKKAKKRTKKLPSGLSKWAAAVKAGRVKRDSKGRITGMK